MSLNNIDNKTNREYTTVIKGEVIDLKLCYGEEERDIDDFCHVKADFDGILLYCGMTDELTGVFNYFIGDIELRDWYITVNEENECDLSRFINYGYINILFVNHMFASAEVRFADVDGKMSLE